MGVARYEFSSNFDGLKAGANAPTASAKQVTALQQEAGSPVLGAKLFVG